MSVQRQDDSPRWGFVIYHRILWVRSSEVEGLLIAYIALGRCSTNFIFLTNVQSRRITFWLLAKESNFSSLHLHSCSLLLQYGYTVLYCTSTVLHLTDPAVCHIIGVRGRWRLTRDFRNSLNCWLSGKQYCTVLFMDFFTIIPYCACFSISLPFLM